MRAFFQSDTDHLAHVEGKMEAETALSFVFAMIKQQSKQETAND